VKVEAKVNTKTEAKVEAKPETKTEAKVEAKPETKSSKTENIGIDEKWKKKIEQFNKNWKEVTNENNEK